MQSASAVIATGERCPHPMVDRVFRERSLPLESGGSTPMDVYIPRDEGDLLYSLILATRPSETLEVGLANGLSTLFIAAGLEDVGAGRHVAIDPFQSTDWRGIGMGLIRQAGLARRVELRELPSHQALPDLEREGYRPSFAFVDGAHLFDYALTDFLVIDRMLQIGGLIAFDDSDWPAVEGVIRYALSNRHYEVACPETVIERPPGRPSGVSRVIRAAARALPPLAARLRSDFISPSASLRILGRCVVLRKLREDDRDSQCKDSHGGF